MRFMYRNVDCYGVYLRSDLGAETLTYILLLNRENDFYFGGVLKASIHTFSVFFCSRSCSRKIKEWEVKTFTVKHCINRHFLLNC